MHGIFKAGKSSLNFKKKNFYSDFENENEKESKWNKPGRKNNF